MKRSVRVRLREKLYYIKCKKCRYRALLLDKSGTITCCYCGEVSEQMVYFGDEHNNI